VRLQNEEKELERSIDDHLSRVERVQRMSTKLLERLLQRCAHAHKRSMCQETS